MSLRQRPLAVHVNRQRNLLAEPLAQPLQTGQVGSEIRHACAQLQLGETANDIALRLLQHLSLAAPEQGLVGVPRRQAIPRPQPGGNAYPLLTRQQVVQGHIQHHARWRQERAVFVI